jgi:hypothetical protein
MYMLKDEIVIMSSIIMVYNKVTIIHRGEGSCCGLLYHAMQVCFVCKGVSAEYSASVFNTFLHKAQVTSAPVSNVLYLKRMLMLGFGRRSICHRLCVAFLPSKILYSVI